MSALRSIRDMARVPDVKLVFAGGAALVVAVLVYRIFFHPLRRIPGPFLAKVTGLWRSYHYMKAKWHEDIVRLHEEYGSVVRIAPNEVSVVHGETCKRLYGHGTSANKTYWYQTWDIPGTAPGVFAVQDTKVHSFLRKRLASAYSMSAMMKMEGYIQGCLDLLLSRLKQHANRGETVDMSEWTVAFAYDVVGELAFGEQLGHLRTETDVMGLRKGIFDGFFIMSILGHFWGQARLMNNWLVNNTLKVLGVHNPLAYFRLWSLERVQGRLDQQKRGTTKERDDMLSHFIRMKGAHGETASVGEVVIESMQIIGAGADTTAIGMRACLYYVCQHPDVYRRLQKEIDDFYEANQGGGPISYMQTQSMPYLQAVVKEATRLFPSINFQLLRHTPSGGLTIDGKFVPEGTDIGVSPIAQNRDKEIWGKDANKFNPDRWLEDEAKSRYYDSMNMLFGGNGPRQCIGRNIALLEMHKFIAQLLLNFDIELVSPEAPWQVSTYWFSYQHDMQMRIKVRPNRIIKDL